MLGRLCLDNWSVCILYLPGLLFFPKELVQLYYEKKKERTIIVVAVDLNESRQTLTLCMKTYNHCRLLSVLI